jgi:hypothetical protein
MVLSQTARRSCASDGPTIGQRPVDLHLDGSAIIVLALIVLLSWPTHSEKAAASR